MTVRVRFPLAPTGRKHIGNYRTMLFNWLFSRSQGGSIVLRFEDTDRERSGREYEQGIEDMLTWLGLDWDEGPYRQSERSTLYEEAADRLEESGHAYRCWCTPDEVEEMRRRARAEKRAPVYDRRCRSREKPGEGPSVLRFAVPLEGSTSFVDMVRGEVTVEHENLNDLVLVRTDGTPVYLLAATLDDQEMGVTHVIRGEDLLPSTPIQILIGSALGRPEPAAFAHVPLIVGPDRAKLSTRHGPVAAEDYRDDGILAEAMVNYMGLLGWSHPEGDEVFTLEEMRDRFDMTRVHSSPAVFDAVKLDSVNFEWIQRLSLEEVCRRSVPFFEKSGYENLDLDLLAAALPLAVPRVKRLSQIPTMLGFLFAFRGYDESAWAKAMKHDAARALLEASLDIVRSIDPVDPATLGEAHNAAADRLGVRYKVAFSPTRVAITGSTVGPPLWESMALLGREECARRLEAALSRLAEERG